MEVMNSSPHSLPGESEGDTIARLLKGALDKPIRIELLPSTGLSDAEHAVISATVETWNAFVLLPIEHPDDQAEFRRLIHAVQSMILMRPTRRAMNLGLSK